MLLAAGVTLAPVLFLAALIGGGIALGSRQIDQGGVAPIAKAPFASSKYAIVVMWGAMVAHVWGVNLAWLDVPRAVRLAALGVWFLGFALLFAGRFGLGDSFRIGSPKERTGLKKSGLFGLSRNPMYLGVYSTLVATVAYTLNPILLVVAGYIIAVHHRIVLAEEDHLKRAFGQEYLDYCRRVRRYL
jgi:protein-S-isoprenylcysteine O-methyltransferase Ste14